MCAEENNNIGDKYLLDDWLNLQLNTNYHKRKAKSSAEAIFTPSEPTSLISSSRASTVLEVNNTTPSFSECAKFFRVHPNFGQTFLPAQIPAYKFMKEIHAPCIELPISRTWHQSHDEITPTPFAGLLTITSEHIVKFPNCWLRFFLTPESRKQKNRYLSLSSQARWQFSFALTSATLHFSIFKPSQCSCIWRFWWFLVKFVKAKSSWRIFAIFVIACISGYISAQCNYSWEVRCKLNNKQ